MLSRKLEDSISNPYQTCLAQTLNILACMLNHFSCVQFCVILWTIACQASLSMLFSRQEY